MSELVWEVGAYVASWPFGFAFIWGLLALLLLASLVAPWLRRSPDRGSE